VESSHCRMTSSEPWSTPLRHAAYLCVFNFLSRHIKVNVFVQHIYDASSVHTGVLPRCTSRWWSQEKEILVQFYCICMFQTGEAKGSGCSYNLIVFVCFILVWPSDWSVDTDVLLQRALHWWGHLIIVETGLLLPCEFTGGRPSSTNLLRPYASHWWSRRIRVLILASCLGMLQPVDAKASQCTV
jgi:hypothetical protein